MAIQGDSNTPKGRVGLDIGSHSIKGVELVEHISELTVRAVGSVSVSGGDTRGNSPDRAALVQAVKHLWSTCKFNSNNVIIGLPQDSVYLKWLRLQCSSEDELDHLARTTAVRGAPFPADDAISDYRIISCIDGGSTKTYHVMLASASAVAVNMAFDIIERAGLELVAVDVSVSAALRSVETERSRDRALWSGQPRAHCVLGAKNTSIGVMREGVLEFARTVPVGGNDLTQCIAERLGVSFDEAEKIKTSPDTKLMDDGILLVSRAGEELQVNCRGMIERLIRETARSLKFFSSQFAEGSYLGTTGTTSLSGGGALLNGIDACLRHNGIEVSGIRNPFSGFSVESAGCGIEQSVGRAAMYTTAMGLAVWDDVDRAAGIGLSAA